MVLRHPRAKIPAACALLFCTVMLWPATAQEVEVAARLTLTETPAVDPEGNVYFIFGYFIPNMLPRIMKLSTNGVLSTYRENFKASSLLFDPQGRLIILGADLQGKPGVTRTDLHTDKTEVLIDNYEGMPLKGPNDMTMDGKGRLYFTDRRGIAVYRVDAPGKIARILAAPDIEEPNGIGVSPDSKTLYVIETNQAKGGARRINAYDLADDGTVSRMRIFYNFYPGRSADGMKVDIQGNVYAVAGINFVSTLNIRPNRQVSDETMDTKCGVYVISPQGTLLKFIPVPEDTITNDAFGGPDMKTLYITAGKTLFKVRTDIPGLRR
jgi:gluconolactonase